MIIIYTGSGKGKTTAAIGMVLRTIEVNEKVAIIQFLKHGDSSEIVLLRRLADRSIKPFDYLTVRSFGRRGFIHSENLTKRDFQIVRKALVFVESVIGKRPFLLILDEILVALKLGLVEESFVLRLVRQCRKKGIHLVLTGRGATSKLIKEADLVTEMKSVKHLYDKGVRAVKGIDC